MDAQVKRRFFLVSRIRYDTLGFSPCTTQNKHQISRYVWYAVHVQADHTHTHTHTHARTHRNAHTHTYTHTSTLSLKALACSKAACPILPSITNTTRSGLIADATCMCVCVCTCVCMCMYVCVRVFVSV